MIKFVHALTGSTMWVHESRVEEYIARGHKLAIPPEAPHEEPPKKTKKTKE